MTDSIVPSITPDIPRPLVAREGADASGRPPPAKAEWGEIAPGILWIRMDVAGPLDHINLWALMSDKVTLVDAGLGDLGTIAAWERVLAGALKGSAVEQLVVTHQHPDHSGGADWLARRCECPLIMSAIEHRDCLDHIAEAARPPGPAVDFLRRAGWPEAMINAHLPFHGRFGQAIGTIPPLSRPLRDGDRLIGGDRTWEVLITAGHSPAHVCLYDRDGGVFIAGDQILPDTPAIVPVLPGNEGADPLGDWLTSLARLHDELAENALVLPSHGEPFVGPHARIGAIIETHMDRLAHAYDLLQTPMTAAEIVKKLYRRAVIGRTVAMLTGEAMAYANRLVALGLASGTVDNGVRRYQRL